MHAIHAYVHVLAQQKSYLVVVRIYSMYVMLSILLVLLPCRSTTTAGIVHRTFAVDEFVLAGGG
jgi:hypothetical protein